MNKNLCSFQRSSSSGVAEMLPYSEELPFSTLNFDFPTRHAYIYTVGAEVFYEECAARLCFCPAVARALFVSDSFSFVTA